jgi:sugar phosphate isomerase/epimerase
VHPQLSVSAVSSWGWTFADDLAYWTAEGIGHVGLSWRKTDEHGVARAARELVERGLRVSNIVELGWLDGHDPSTWPHQRDRLTAAVELASLVGGCLVLTTGPAFGLSWDDAADRLAEAWAPVLAAAIAAGVTLTVENTGPLRLDLSFTTALRDTCELARRLGVGVCLEVNSCFAERDLAVTIAEACAEGLLAHVQVNDFVVGSLSTPDRAVPGDGDIALDEILGAIVAGGYRGAFEIEMVGPRIETEGYASAIRRAVTHVDALLVGASARLRDGSAQGIVIPGSPGIPLTRTGLR